MAPSFTRSIWASVGRLTFVSGERSKLINITILDNAVPEADKHLEVELLNPADGAQVNPDAGVARIVISHSDFAHGVFGFHKNSLLVEARENPDRGLNVARFRVIREGGTIGPVNVTWRVTSDPEFDLELNEGVLRLADGQWEEELELPVRDDSRPELEERFTISIIHVTAGIVGQTHSAELVVTANDDPYGRFFITSQNRPVYVDEDDEFVEIVVERQAGTFGSVQVSYATLLPSEAFSFLPTVSVRANLQDFNNTSGLLTFHDGERSRAFYVTLLSDEGPEVEESMFARLLAVELLDIDQENTVVAPPRLGPSTETYAHVIISENDDARGVLQLSAAHLQLQEENAMASGQLLYVTRTAGTFGTVSVRFEVVQGTAAYGLDYTLISTTVLLGQGQSRAAVPVQIVDDLLPELQEQFTIRLVNEITGGARLGSRTECLVTILQSDDPNGAFGFESTSVSALEPATDHVTTVEVAVVRLGGTLGVVHVEWTARNTDGSAVEDISPVSGSVHFVSNSARQVVVVNVLPDTIPEHTEEILLELVSVTGGGRILNERAQFILSILSNDSPHGTIHFSTDVFAVTEPEEDTLQYIPISRAGGTFGTLRVYYAVRELDILAEVAVQNEDIMDYYKPPQDFKPLPLIGTKFEVRGQDNPLQACASLCLLSPACQAFDYNSNRVDCNWFTNTDYENVDNRTGYVFYEKLLEKSDILYTRMATPGLDFGTVQRQALVLEQGTSVGWLPVQVTPDQLPELVEQCRVELLGVELVDDIQDSNTDNAPQLGNQTRAYITIETNDNAHGVFRIYALVPEEGTQGSVGANQESAQLIGVNETDNLAVELVVERIGGSIFAVSVGWQVLLNQSTASRGADFIADGAVLQFEPGETQRSIILAIQDDILPETDEVLVVALWSPGGGATLDAPPNTKVTVRINANDHVAGVLGFQRSAYLAREGDVVVLRVLRSEPALGDVSADWRVEATPDSQPASMRFRQHTGTLYYEHGSLEQQVTLHVLVDNQPKVNQEYHMILDQAETQGIRATGRAVVDPQRAVSVVTIEGGHDPHGVFSFSFSAQSQTRVSESNNTAHIAVDRKFGAIGAVRLYFDVTAGSLTSPGDLIEAALPDLDFLSVTSGHVVIYDGESAAILRVTVMDDEEPEIDEVFLVTLVRVELVNPEGSTFQPRLANTGIRTEVIIAANDGTQGEVHFQQQANLTVEEGRRDVTLLVHRSRGTFGSVSVFCFVQNSRGGAVRGEDFHFDPTEIYFGAGVSEQLITIEILEDTVPEPDEVFEIVLASPKNGLVIGEPARAMIKILASDASSGVVQFVTGAPITLMEPSDSAPSDSHYSRAVVTLVRAPGVYGQVTVPFSIVTDTGDDVTDLTLASGAVVFNNLQDTATLELAVTPDSLPEEDEHFTLVLHTPSGGASLGEVTQRAITVERNDAPYGSFQIQPVGSLNSTLSIDESAGAVYFDVTRHGGVLGWVSVDLLTSQASARASTGQRVVMGRLQTLDTEGGRWCTFSAGTKTFALYLRQDLYSDSVFYMWQGTLVQKQTLRTNGASSCGSFSEGSSFYVVITNIGERSRRDTDTQVFRLTPDYQLTLIQELRSKGGSGVAFYHNDGSTYMLVLNYENSLGNTSIPSSIYQWDRNNARFELSPVHQIPTNGAVDAKIFTTEDATFLIVLNSYKSSTQAYNIWSVMYKLDTNGIWNIVQHIPTRGAIRCATFSVGFSTFLVIANQRDDAGNYTQMVEVYVWNSASQLMELVQALSTNDVQNVEITYYENKVYLSISAHASPSTLLQWHEDVGQFNEVWYGLSSNSFQAVLTQNNDGHEELFYVIAETNNATETERSAIYQMGLLANEADYTRRHSTLHFGPDESHMRVAVHVIDDVEPEAPELFFVGLGSPRHGAELGATRNVTVAVQANDNGHGIIEIAPDSLIMHEEELPSRDNTVIVHVIRRAGSFGHVIVSWRLSGEHNGVYDIRPVVGVVEFSDGQSASTIVLTIRDDGLPELDETTVLTFTRVVQSGDDTPGSGAVLGDAVQSRITVLANDSPFGVVGWATLTFTVDEPDTSATSLSMRIVREQGSLGDIAVTYITVSPGDATEDDRAVSGRDFVAVQSSVEMREGVTAADVIVNILPDDNPELSERFFLNITDVRLLSAFPGNSSRPSVSATRRQAEVTIRENDNPRGLVQFNVVRNAENRLDTYEGAQRVTLTLLRTSAYFGDVEVTWQTVPREAGLEDFRPGSGPVKFEEGQRDASIEIEIMDDTVPENLETFDVVLWRVVSGGAELGSDTTLRVGILRSDSPTGVFSFSNPQYIVRESRDPADPNGVVSCDVTRRGSDGDVRLQWRLDAEGAQDFLPPTAGQLTFHAGETWKTISLRTRPDSILEGRENYTLSLVSADNNAIISPTAGDTVITIEADQFASGSVRIAEEARFLVISEPSAAFDGAVNVPLDRGVGVFGVIDVTWQIVPRDPSAFIQTQGVVSFADLQRNASILLLARDDSSAELRTTFTLELTSATGGATLAPTPEERCSHIVYAASDFPHGLFEFAQPAEVQVEEDQDQVNLLVRRSYGSTGEVTVHYTTVAGTASDLPAAGPDLRASLGTLRFAAGQLQAVITIFLVDDDISEGPEYFFVNLTRLQRAFPDTNNYTVINDVQLDMPPDFGPLTAKKVTITKNDNAEGFVQFAPEASYVKVSEDVGEALLRIERYPSSFGDITVTFTTQNGSAMRGSDFIVSNSTTTILDGERTGVFTIQIVNDGEREFDENFVVVLTAVSDGGRLGPDTTATVTIAKSDYPNGKLSFVQREPLVLDNPESMLTLPITVVRSGGALGHQTLMWRILGPNNVNRVLQETNDVSMVEPSGREGVRGQLTWEEGQLGPQTFILHVKPYNGWEVEETFVIAPADVQAFPAGVGSAEMDPDDARFTLVIRKHGDPNGIVRFDGVAQLSRNVDEPTGGVRDIAFPVMRREGTTGDITIYWRIEGLSLNPQAPDVSPLNGTLLLPSGQREGVIELQVLDDDVPEVNEHFRLVLERVTGGAEIDKLYNVSTFTIRHNDAPHGRFSVDSVLQTVVVTSPELARRVRLNITRQAGRVGRVRVAFALSFHQAQTGVSYVPTSGSVTFNHSQGHAVVHVPVETEVFLPSDSSFTLALTSVTYIGADMTEPPSIVPTQAVASVQVPELAASSHVVFSSALYTVNETTDMAEIVVQRSGSYGRVQVTWQAGGSDPLPPRGFRWGSLVPDSGELVLEHAQREATFTVTLHEDFHIAGAVEAPSIYALHLTGDPETPASGGARLGTVTECRVEPHGVLQFAAASRNVIFAEPENGDTQVSLRIERRWGALGNIQVRYSTVSGTAHAQDDFRQVREAAVTLGNTQTHADIFLTVKADEISETDEYFYVNVTSVSLLPTDVSQSLSPHLSALHALAKITISSNSDPYGVLSIEPSSEFSNCIEPSTGQLRIKRTGGSFGAVRVQVRSVGGGEPWDSMFDTAAPGTEDTIAHALGTRDLTRQAQVGEDYRVVETVIELQDGQNEALVSLHVYDDTQPEDDEFVYIYVTSLTSGVRVATPVTYVGRKGFVRLAIDRNDYWSGWVGFYGANSTNVVANEDSNKPTILTIERRNASFGDVQVYWRAVLQPGLDELVNKHMDLTLELQQIANKVECATGQQYCTFPIFLQQESKPENESVFYIELTQTSTGADIDPQRKYATVTMVASDYPNGLIQFHTRSRYLHISKSAQTVILEIERLGYLQKRIDVLYETRSFPNSIVIAGVSVSAAVAGRDFPDLSGRIEFQSGESIKTIEIALDLSQASLKPYPKAFQGVLLSANGNAELRMTEAYVSIVEGETEAVWEAWALGQLAPLTNDSIQRLTDELLNSLESPIRETELNIAKSTLNQVIEVGRTHLLSTDARNSIMSIFCRLLQANVKDATFAQWQLAQLLESFAFTFLHHLSCDTCCTDPGAFLTSPSCPWVTFRVAKWYPEQINVYEYQFYNGEFIKLPSNLLSLSRGQNSDSPKCEAIVFVKYSSDQWFDTSSPQAILNSRIFSVSILDRPTGVLDSPVNFRISNSGLGPVSKDSACLFFDEAHEDWTNSLCEVTSNLDLAMDNYVTCSCRHISSYAVSGSPWDSNKIGYPVWFFLFCFVAMFFLGLTVVCHIFCSIYARFSANLVMHMCCAILCTEMIYIINAFISPGHLFHIDQSGSSNYRCVVMGMFTHYFFLAQFTWLLLISINFYKILILNDERMERKYAQIVILGWGVPFALVFAFYLTTYLIYRYALDMSTNNIYGDVHNNRDICFITEPLAGLAGVIIPVILCVLVAGVIFIQAYQVTPQWQSYDDVYLGRPNIFEVRLLLCWWFLLGLTWLWGGLHLAYSQLWMLVLLCIFNFVIAAFALLVYGLLRLPHCPCLRPQIETAYSLNEGIDDKPVAKGRFTPPPSQDTSLDSISADLQNFENASITNGGSQLRYKRKPVTAHSPPFHARRPAYWSGVRHTPTELSVGTATTEESIVKDSRNVEDLIFALKSASMSETSVYDTDVQGHYSLQGHAEVKAPFDSYRSQQMRSFPSSVRIVKHKIMDTHF